MTCKYCLGCEAWHPLADYYTDRHKPDGLRPYCKTCDIRRTRSVVSTGPRKQRSDAQRGLQTCKFCLYHQAWEPITDYYTDRAKADGMGSYCKAAMLARATRR